MAYKKKAKSTVEKVKEPPAKMGRPLSVTPEVLAKLCDAFSFGCSDIEACLEADISRATLYNYEKTHPEFIDRKEELKQAPFLASRKTVVRAARTDPNHAEWYLERKGKAEFGSKTSIDYTQSETQVGTNADVVGNAFLSLTPEEQSAILAKMAPPIPPTTIPEGNPTP